MQYGRWALFACSIFFVACASTPTTNPSFERFTLDNGLEVVIWPSSNREFKDEVKLDLVILAGSEDEQPDQAGYAHFVEHMVFSQQDDTGANPIDAKLDQLSLTGASHANAYTTFDRTQYYLSFRDVTEAKLQVGVDLLAQFAFGAQFDKQLVEREKSIIEAERRYRDNPNKAAFQLTQAALAGHPRQTQMPIGRKETIAATSAGDLSQFYQQHYRPDNALLVVAGEVDVASLRTLIISTFSLWEKPQSQYSSAPVVSVTPTPSIQKRQASDMVGSLMIVNGFFMPWSPDDPQYQQRMLMTDAILYSVKERLRRVAKAEALQADFNVYFGAHSTDRLLGSLGMEVHSEAAYLPAASALLAREWARMVTYGMTQTELDSWRNMVLQKEKNNNDSAAHLVNVAIDGLRFGAPMQGQAAYFQFIRTYLPSLTLDSVQPFTQEILTFAPSVILLQNPNEAVPIDEQIQQWLTWPPEVSAPAALAVTDTDVALAVTKTPGGIVSKQTLASGIDVYQLQNGMTVYYSRMPGEQDVKMLLIGLGGMNALSEEEVILARFAPGVMGESGIRDLDGQQLGQWLKERDMMLRPYFTSLSRELEVKAPLSHHEDLFRIAHLALTEGQVDESVLHRHQQEVKAMLAQLSTLNRDAFDRQVESVLYANDVAQRRLTPLEVDNMSKSAMNAMYQHRFAGAQNYQVFLVGDLDETTLRAHLRRYMASLPATENALVEQRESPKLTQSQRVIGSGIGGDASFITLLYEADKTTFPNLDLVLLLNESKQFSDALTDAIRKELGLTYSIRASFSGASNLDNVMRMQIDVSVAPDQVENVIAAIKQQLQLRTQIASEPEVAQATIDQEVSAIRSDYQKAYDSTRRMKLMATASLLNRPLASLHQSEVMVRPYDVVTRADFYRAFTDESARLVEFVLNP